MGAANNPINPAPRSFHFSHHPFVDILDIFG
jgi:hypothetical protein